MKQTAVEWLYDQLTSTWFEKASCTDILKKAKEMEKEQIKKAFHKNSQKFFCELEAEQYYNETFKSE